jgi:hypothetical protein
MWPKHKGCSWLNLPFSRCDDPAIVGHWEMRIPDNFPQLPVRVRKVSAVTSPEKSWAGFAQALGHDVILPWMNRSTSIAASPTPSLLPGTVHPAMASSLATQEDERRLDVFADAVHLLRVVAAHLGG